MAVEKAIEQFVQRGMEIIQDNPDGRNDLIAALDEVKQTGQFSQKSFITILFIF